MKIIIVSGNSGSGKSTIARLLAEKLENSKYIEADKFIWDKMIALHMDWIKQEFGENVEHLGHMEEQNIEKTKAFIRLILRPTDKLLEHEVVQAQNDGFDYLILDWAFILNLPLSEMAHYHVSIECDTKTRHRFLHKRLKERFGEVKENKAANRDLIDGEFHINQRPIDYIVLNDFDKNTLSDESHKIADKIKELKILHKRFSAKCTICSCHLNKGNEEKYISDTILYETENFFVMPAYHGITKGYTLLSPIRCISSVSYMRRAEFDELKRLIDKKVKLLENKFGFRPAIWEHGVPNSSLTGTYHDHMHFFPARLVDVDTYIRKLGLIHFEDIDDLPDMGKDKDFLYVQSNDGKMYFGETNNNTMKILQSWTAATIGDPDANFKPLNEYEDNIRKTIEMWEEAKNFML